MIGAVGMADAARLGLSIIKRLDQLSSRRFVCRGKRVMVAQEDAQ